MSNHSRFQLKALVPYAKEGRVIGREQAPLAECRRGSRCLFEFQRVLERLVTQKDAPPPPLIHLSRPCRL